MSEKYGAVVLLCHNRCHIFGERAVHKCRETDLLLKRKAEEKIMKENGWDIEEFIRVFGKNYL